MLGVEAVLPDGTVLDLLHTLRKDNTGCAGSPRLPASCMGRHVGPPWLLRMSIAWQRRPRLGLANVDELPAPSSPQAGCSHEVNTGVESTSGMANPLYSWNTVAFLADGRFAQPGA